MAENPQAFPVSTIDGFTHEGMTLRDWFAGQALSGCVDHNFCNDWGRDGKAWPPLVAARCYRLADAMLTERSKP